jgi:putative membrane protein
MIHSKISFGNTAITIQLYFKICLLLFSAFWLYFLFTTRSQTNWWIENILVLLFIPVLISLQSRQPFSYRSIICIFLFLLTHIYGAQMSYTYNQFGALLQTHFQLSRNPYDRLVHFSFGLFASYPLYEIFVHRWQCNHKWSCFLSCWTVLGLATIFELVEWLVAACTDSATGESYVATQGDIWDAHKDIALALLSALLINLLIYKYHRGKAATFFPSDTNPKEQ